ncbi:MAG TPA: sigma-54-dependent Fis family transcriptional regulator [Pirellulaceae bacterium]|jgi:Nif-specific regulatory protein
MTTFSHPADRSGSAVAPEFIEAVAFLFCEAATQTDRRRFLQETFPPLARTAGYDFAALLHVVKGNWQPLVTSGPSRTLPIELISDALDRGDWIEEGGWQIGPLLGNRSTSEVLAVYRGQRPISAKVEKTLGECLAKALEIVDSRVQVNRQLARHAVLLDIAAQWQQNLGLDKLLVRLAEAAARLLDAERASIFLWDKQTHTLVGRPALGISGSELRIADDSGIVGQVVHTGQARRVDADSAAEQREIDRRVDQRLKFETRSLLCVPLTGKNGDIFGAFEVLNKRGGSFTADDEQALAEIAHHASIGLESTQEWEELLAARQNVADQAEQRVRLIGECPAIQALRSTIEKVADTELSVLVLGPNGTGKEVVAQLIHYKSRRRQEPLLAVNCAALTESLLESELFGHEKGAFTDARAMHKGKFELAARGTLFLDEIGDMSLAGQAKLLRALEEKTIVRVGGSMPITTNTRIIAATNQNLAELVRQHRFREDLYFRVSVVAIDLPSLKDRGDDVLLLAEYFLKHFCGKARRRTPKFTAAAKKRLVSHLWPGNIRELRNLMERLAFLAPEEQDKIDAPDLAFILSPTASATGQISLDLPLADATREFQRDYIQRRIERVRGNMTAAAEQLGLQRSNLYRKMRQLEMDGADES